MAVRNQLNSNAWMWYFTLRLGLFSRLCFCKNLCYKNWDCLEKIVFKSSFLCLLIILSPSYHSKHVISGHFEQKKFGTNFIKSLTWLPAAVAHMLFKLAMTYICSLYAKIFFKSTLGPQNVQILSHTLTYSHILWDSIWIVCESMWEYVRVCESMWEYKVIFRFQGASKGYFSIESIYKSLPVRIACAPPPPAVRWNFWWNLSQNFFCSKWPEMMFWVMKTTLKSLKGMEKCSKWSEIMFWARYEQL